MLKEAHLQLYSIVRAAVPEDVPVVWAPYSGPLDCYPRIVLQLIRGPESERLGYKVATPINLRITVTEPAVRLTLGCRDFAVTAATVEEAAQALLEEIRLCGPSWELLEIDSTTFSVSDPSLTLFDALAIEGAEIVTAEAAEAARYTVYRETVAFQVTAVAIDPRAWSDKGSVHLANLAKFALGEPEKFPSGVAFRPTFVNTFFGDPTGQSEWVIQTSVDVEANYVTCVERYTEFLDCVEGTVMGQDVEIRRP